MKAMTKWFRNCQASVERLQTRMQRGAKRGVDKRRATAVGVGAKNKMSFETLEDRLVPTLLVPYDIDPAANSVVEGSAQGTSIGVTAEAIDTESNTVTYRLIDNAGGRFAINASTGVVTVANGQLLNNAQSASHTIVVEAENDEFEITSSEPLTIQVTPSLIAPTIETLTANNVDLSGTVRLQGTYSYQGSVVEHMLRVDWGEGEPQTVTVQGGSFDITHQYVDDDPGNPNESYRITAQFDGESYGPQGLLVSNLVPNFPPPPDRVDSFTRLNSDTGANLGTFIGGGLLGPGGITLGAGGITLGGGITYGPDGNLYVGGRAPSGGLVLRYNGQTGAFIDVFVSPSSALNSPTNMEFGPDGNLYVTAIRSDRINRYDGTTGAFLDRFISVQFPADALFGPDVNGDDYPDLYVGSPDHLIGDQFFRCAIRRYDGRTGAFIDLFNSGEGIAGLEQMVFGPDGNLYVTSGGTNNVVRYDAETGAFLGQFVASGTGGLNDPISLIFQPNGDLLVSSWNNAQADGSVLQYDATGSFLGEFAGNLTGPKELLYLRDFTRSWRTCTVRKLPFDNDPAANSVREEPPTGMPVGLTVFASVSSGATITYSLTNDAGGRFAIRASCH